MNQFTYKLYTLISRDGDNCHIQLADATHPLFQAHFPTMPILPAFITIDLIQELYHVRVIEVKNAKFLKPILPNENITYKRIDDFFKVYNKDKIVASLNLCTVAL